VRTLGKRVKGNLSRVQIPHPPPEGSLWITFTPVSKNLHSCGMKLPNKKKTAISLALFLIANLYSDTAIAAEPPEPGPKTQCFIKIGDPHISTYLNERRRLKAVKVDAESRCNFFQKNVALTVTIFKVGRFSDHFVNEFRTDPANSKSSGFTVKNWQTYRECKNEKETIYYGVASSQAEINGKLLRTVKARSNNSKPLKCGT
jgi:hypothetical protein